MKLLTPKYLPEYRSRQRSTLEKHVARIERRGNKFVDFQRWARIAGAVASSQIEGSTVTVDEFMEAAPQDIRRSRELKQVQELVHAYELAARLKINRANLPKVHGILGDTLSAGRWKPGGAQRPRACGGKNRLGRAGSDLLGRTGGSRASTDGAIDEGGNGAGR